MTVPLFVAGSADELPAGRGENTAFAVEDRESSSYAGLDARSRRWADHLLARGVRPGDRVGLLLLNATEYVVAYLAATRIGAIAVRFNWRLTARELAGVLDTADCTVLFAHTSFTDTLASALRERRPLVLAVVDNGPVPEWAEPATLLDEPVADPPAHPEPDAGDDAMIMFTSGTTGVPKGAVWTHANTTSFAAIQAVGFGFGSGTVAMTTGPLYHAGAFEDLLHPALLVGGTAVCMRSGALTVRRVLEVAAHHGVTDVLLYPFLLDELLALPDLTPDTLPALRRIVTGGDPVRGSSLDTAAARLPGVEIVQAYGLTEGGGMTSFLPGAEARAHPGSVGSPLPLTQVRVIDDDLRPCPAGTDGEILTRSPSVARGYWRNPQATTATFVDGWCRTGDVGRIVDGRLHVTGRKKDMIRSGGENIYAAEVELAVAEHPAVADVAAIAVPDARYLEAVCVVVVPAEGESPSLEQIVEHCRPRLAGYKIPRHVALVPALPRSPSGKVLRARLRETYADLGTTTEDA